MTCPKLFSLTYHQPALCSRMLICEDCSNWIPPPVHWFLVEFSQLVVLTGTRPAATLLSCRDVLELLTRSDYALPTPTLRSVPSPWGLGIRYDGSVYTTGTKRHYKSGILTTEPVGKPLPSHHWLCFLTEDHSSCQEPSMAKALTGSRNLLPPFFPSGLGRQWLPRILPHLRRLSLSLPTLCK